jgi:hypothetical protein
VAVEPTGPLNSRYGPWNWSVDAKMSKGLTIYRQNLDLYLWVLNIFDRENVVDVYTSSGSARTTNFLNSPDGEAFVAANADTYGADRVVERYRLGELDPTQFSVPRMVRFGAKLSF